MQLPTDLQITITVLAKHRGSACKSKKGEHDPWKQFSHVEYFTKWKCNWAETRDSREREQSWWCLAPPVLTCPGRAAGRHAALSHGCGNTDAKAALLWKVLFVSCIFYFSSLFTSVYCSSLSLSLWDKIIFYKWVCWFSFWICLSASLTTLLCSNF